MSLIVAVIVSIDCGVLVVALTVSWVTSTTAASSFDSFIPRLVLTLDRISTR